MKYKVRVSELRYGEVEVEAASEREAKNKATRTGFNFFDSEITDMTAEKVVSSDPMSVIERLERWAKGDTCDNCPACDDTHHSGTGNCDYSRETDSCRRNPPVPAAAKHKLWMRLGVTLNITEDEADAILGEDKHNSTLTLRGVLRAGRFEPDGESYIPGESIESYNHAHGTEYDDADVDFNL